MKILPQEIYDGVIHHLHSEDDRSALRATARAHSSFRHAAQQLLFAHIHLYPSCVSLKTSHARPSGSTTAARHARLLSSAPHLAHHITRLDIHLLASYAQWVGWTPLVEFLPLLTRLRALGVHVDQTSAWAGSGYVPMPMMMSGPRTGGAVDGGADKERVCAALRAAVGARGVRVLDVHCMEVGLFLGAARYTQELRLSAPIVGVVGVGDSSGLVSEGAGRDSVALEGLRIENAFDLEGQTAYYASTLSRALRAQGVALHALKQLIVIYRGPCVDRCVAEVRGLLDECNDTLEELEVGGSLKALDLETLAQHKSTALLPSLHLLRLQLPTPSDGRKAFVAALTSFMDHLSASGSSTLARLVLTDTTAPAVGSANATSPTSTSTTFTTPPPTTQASQSLSMTNWDPLLRDILADRKRFPGLRIVSVQCSEGGPFAMDQLRAEMRSHRQGQRQAKTTTATMNPNGSEAAAALPYFIQFRDVKCGV